MQVLESRDLTLFLAPEAGVTPHFNALCILGRTLQERGHRVLFTRCTGVFTRCPVMDMHQMPYEGAESQRQAACANCTHYSGHAFEAYGLDYADLSQLISPELEAVVQATMQAAPQRLLDFTFEGIAFGKACALDLVYGTKVSQFETMDPMHRTAWLQYIENSLRTYLLMDRLFQEISVARLVHFNDYTIMLGARFAAEKHGIPCLSMTQAAHMNVDRRAYVIRPTVWRQDYPRVTAAWPEWKHLALSPRQVKGVFDDAIVRLSGNGSHVYSPAKTNEAKDLWSRLGLTSDRQLLVAFTSSLDEHLAGRYSMEGLGVKVEDPPQPFEDQIAWLRALTEFVEASADLQLVIRIHPREGKNKREAVSSQHLLRLRENFDRPFRYCRIVWPEEAVSSYDLGEVADLVLTSWSTIGLEFARLGAPVLTSTSGISQYPHEDFLEWGATPEQYFGRLRDLLGRETTLAHLKGAFRAYHLFHRGISLELNDLIPAHDFTGLPVFHLPHAAADLEAAVVRGEDVLAINRAKLLQQQSSEDLEREDLSLKQQLRRMIHFLFTGQDLSDDRELVLLAGNANVIEPGALPAHTMVLLIDGRDVVLFANGQRYAKRSPLCARLAPLCANRRFENFYEGLYRLSQDASPTRFLTLCRYHLERSDLPAALKVSEEALRVSPGLRDLLIALSEAQFLAGHVEHARGLLELLLALAPDHTPVLNNLSVIEWESGKQEEALRYSTESYRLNPLDRASVSNLGDILTALGHHDDASAVYVRYLSAAGEDPEILARVAALQT